MSSEYFCKCFITLFLLSADYCLSCVSRPPKPHLSKLDLGAASRAGEELGTEGQTPNPLFGTPTTPHPNRSSFHLLLPLFSNSYLWLCAAGKLLSG